MLDVKKERKKSGRNISLLAYQTFNLPAFHFYSPCWPIRSAPGHIIAEGQRGEVRGFPRKDPVQRPLPPPCCSLRGSDGLPIKDASRWLTKGGHNSRARVLGSSRSLAGRANTVVLRRVAPKRTAVRVQREEEEEEDKKAGGERESSPRHLPTL